MNQKDKPKLITGGNFTNEKGTIRFVNDFSLAKFKRFYQIELPKKNIIRAFHGHMKESKAVFVLSGSIYLCTVKLTDTVSPSKKIKVKKITMDSKKTNICLIPPGFANGIMSLQANTQVIFFSDKSVEQSENDDFRFNEDYWGKKIWKNE